jgi:hypothetical protein
MVISSCDAGTGVSGDAAQFALSASGAKANPNAIVITTSTQLAEIGNSLPADGDYVLGNDLTLTTWFPLCDPQFEQKPFTGTFDGAGYTITTTVAQYVGGFSGYARDTQFTNITVTGSLAANSIGPVDNYNVGGVTGFAADSTFTNVRVGAGLRASAPINPPPSLQIWRGNDTFRARSVGADIGEDGLAIGGVAGYAKNSRFLTITVTSSIGVSTVSSSTGSAPAYAGGVAGSANTVTIENSQSSSSIIVSGPGYNTAAGGIAGYLLAGTIRNASATGSVDLTSLGVDFGWDDSWQNYAGGLVGYAGGTDTAASYITRSYATGSASATAPFPYAGGFIGYVYGYNNFEDPAKNGTTITESYATGTVTATAQATSGDIPYAGGFAGYSSIGDSRIVDSYARGSATVTTDGTYAWAGGFIGGNANNSVILRVYATGDVSSTTGSLPPLYAPLYADAGPAAGGIAGFNYYSANTSISDSFALNATVRGNQTTAQDVVHRVAGSIGNTSGIGTLNNNLANEVMTVTDNWKQDFGLDRRDGLDTNAVPAQSVYAGLGWLFGSIWKIGTDNYPALQWQ